MEKRPLLRTVLQTHRDKTIGSSSWKRLLLIAASIILLIGVVVLIRTYSDVYLRLSALTLIFMSLGCYVVVLTSMIASRYYRTWPIVIGAMVAALLFLIGFVFFFVSFQY